jgi:outer membrane murein-binding lipoprotein Lpp
MSRANKALVVLVVATLGLWGCAQGPGNGSADKIQSLEDKVSKLEDECKAVTSARDAVRKKLAALEEEYVKKQQELDQQIAARTAERDSVQTQFEQFRKNLRTLLGQADAAAGTSFPPPAAAATAAIDPNKS